MENKPADPIPAETKPAEPQPAASKQPSGLARGCALMAAILLVIAIPLALLAFNVWRVVFNPPLVKTILTDEVVNSDLIPVFLEWFSERRARQRVEFGEALTGVDEPDIVLLLSFMTRDDWREVKQEVLTDEFLTHVVSVTVDGTYAWIDSADRVPQITYDLQPFVDRVNSEHGTNAIKIAYDNLAPCTDDEIADFLARLGAVPPGVEVLYNLCRFPDPWFEDQFSDYVNSLFKVVQNVPVQFALTQELQRLGDQGGVGPEALKGQLRLIRTLGMLAWVLPVVLLLLILVLVVRNLRGLARWIGAPLMVGGALALLPALVYRPLVTRLLAGGALSETPQAVIEETTRVILRLAGEIFAPMLVQAVVIVAIGLGLVILYWVRGRPPKPASAAPSPAA